jgi:chemosensory pili system protein ChpA (sensor histidine kinase/response regulator)
MRRSQRSDWNMMKRILIVDDSLTIQRVLKHTLQRAGYDVTSLSSGSEAMEHLSQTMVDLAIVDLSMPEMDGISLVRNLRGDSRAAVLPVVMLTASGTLEDRAGAQDAGVNAFLTKPVSSSELLDTVGQLLDV